VRQQSSYRIGRVVLNPARIETGKNEIILHEPAAKLVLHAAETKSRADLADSSLDAIEQNRPTECSSAATLTLFTAGVHFSSVNLVHVLPRPTNDALPLGDGDLKRPRGINRIAAREWQGIAVICVPSLGISHRAMRGRPQRGASIITSGRRGVLRFSVRLLRGCKARCGHDHRKEFASHRSTPWNAEEPTDRETLHELMKVKTSCEIRL